MKTSTVILIVCLLVYQQMINITLSPMIPLLFVFLKHNALPMILIMDIILKLMEINGVANHAINNLTKQCINTQLTQILLFVWKIAMDKMQVEINFSHKMPHLMVIMQ